MENLKEEKFYIDSKDDDIVETFIEWKKESQSYHDQLLKKQKVSEDYYNGNQTDRDLVAPFDCNVVENRIFEAVETIAPVCTANAHQFMVMPGNDNEKSLEKARNLQKVLSRKYEELEMQKKLETTIRHLMLFRFGCLKWVWDEILNDVDVKVIDPRLIMVPKMRLDPHDLPYKMEIQEYTRQEIEEYFPKAKIDELVTEDAVDTGKSKDAKKVYRVFEVWTPEMVAWFSNNKLLDRKANPYWDFEGQKKKYIDMEGKEPKVSSTLKYRNHFDKPTDPYVFFTTFEVGDEPFGSTSLIEIGIPIQDAINTQKRQIIDNLRRMGNGQIYMDDDAMSEEKAENITTEAGLVIRGDGVASQNKIRREPGVPLPAGHFENLSHSEMMFDNIMGVHGATRGQAGSKTLGQDIISRQQDYTRIDLITRVLNRGVARLADGLAQLMKLFYTENHVIKILGEDGAISFVNFNRDDVEDDIVIDVKSGMTLPVDKITQRTEAVQLWQLGAIDPVTLFERLEFPNPEKSAERLLAWKTGQLSQDTMAKIQLAKAQAEMGNAASISQINAKGANEVAKIGEQNKGRAVETAMNSLQRANANLGGTAPSLPKTPKLEGQKQ
ncbi:MAG: hypothetical protein VKN72_04745 [Nostocales cyanobacterium 94392]|nr:hypothetical protein [Nostocales cyanobacterium 94392]